MKTRQMYDKNTLRLRMRETFIGLIPKREVLQEFELPENTKNVKVFVRKRPMSRQEMNNKDFDVVETTQNTVVVADCKTLKDLTTPNIIKSRFFADYVFDETATEMDVFNEALLPWFAGDSPLTTIFMLGQTGAGKSYTMKHMMEHLSHMLFQTAAEIQLQAFEVDSKQIRDLIADKEISLCTTKSDLFRPVGVEGVTLQDAEDFRRTVERNFNKRITKKTTANSVSSRTHLVWKISMEDTRQLWLVDFAGTERNKDSFRHDSDRQTESTRINDSWFAIKTSLRNREQALRENNMTLLSLRASSITRLLSPCLAKPGSDIIFMACLSPCAMDTEHSMSTLKTAFLC